MAGEQLPNQQEPLATGEMLNRYIDDQIEQQNALLTQPVLQAFARELAARIGEGVVPLGYVNATDLLTYDCQTGVNGFTGEPMPYRLTRQHPAVYSGLNMAARHIGWQGIR